LVQLQDLLGKGMLFALVWLRPEQVNELLLVAAVLKDGDGFFDWVWHVFFKIDLIN
jgi:hypothetical protein